MRDVFAGVVMFAGVVALVTFVGWILLLGYLKANQRERRLVTKDTMVWARSDERARLRAKVEALTHDGLTASQSQVVLKREVLALLDGDQ